jgi:hypothetical protein
MIGVQDVEWGRSRIIDAPEALHSLLPGSGCSPCTQATDHPMPIGERQVVLNPRQSSLR